VLSQLSDIKSQLQQIQYKESNLAIARAHTMSARDREDKEFLLLANSAKTEKEVCLFFIDLSLTDSMLNQWQELRRQERVIRQSIGPTSDGQTGLPPALHSGLPETSAFSKQQSPLNPWKYQIQLPPMTSIQRQQQQRTVIKGEAYNDRKGYPDKYDKAGRALWKRPSDEQLVYLNCPKCGEFDFLTLQGFMCHLTRVHSYNMGNQLNALEHCGTLYRQVGSAA